MIVLDYVPYRVCFFESQCLDKKAQGTVDGIRGIVNFSFVKVFI